MISYFDQMTHPFKCSNPKCGEPFKKPLRSLFHADEVVCPKCGATEDIRESKRAGSIGLDFHTASELDKQVSKEK